MRIALTLMYDGTDYHGFQRQKNGITIQEALENAVYKMTGEKVCVLGCGRTDAGVHAKRYTAVFDTNSAVPLDKMPIALNTHLKDDIRIISAKAVDDDFHPVFSAKRKTYSYRILNAEINNAFERRYAWFYPQKLDVELMKKAAENFLGEHDFSAFMASGSNVSTTVRTIYSLNVTKENDIIKIEITANGFLYNMVRIITGTLVYAGIGKIKPEEIKDILKSGNRTLAGITAPPQGLFLERATY